MDLIPLAGSGRFMCPHCNHGVVFQDPNVTMYLEILSFPMLNRSVVFDVKHNTIEHYCGLDHYWECPACGGTDAEEDVLQRHGLGNRKRRALNIRYICVLCGEQMEQRVRKVELA